MENHIEEIKVRYSEVRDTLFVHEIGGKVVERVMGQAKLVVERRDSFIYITASCDSLVMAERRMEIKRDLYQAQVSNYESADRGDRWWIGISIGVVLLIVVLITKH